MRRRSKTVKKIENVCDILSVSDLTSEKFVEILQNRYNSNEIYTFVGPIVIAVNPYQRLDALYSEDCMDKYAKGGDHKVPHVFVVADRAYRTLVHSLVLSNGKVKDTVKNQSILVSGKSGAGKTETTKVIMQYLARLSHRKSVSESTCDGKLGLLEDKVLESNPLLEAFGNARTMNNDNSSRFGKFIEIQFNARGDMVGAEIMNFLLEKTRIVSQCLQERNYHIFYQVFLFV